MAYAHALGAEGQWHDAADVLHAAKAAAESSQVSQRRHRLHMYCCKKVCIVVCHAAVLVVV